MEKIKLISEESRNLILSELAKLNILASIEVISKDSDNITVIKFNGDKHIYILIYNDFSKVLLSRTFILNGVEYITSSSVSYNNAKDLINYLSSWINNPTLINYIKSLIKSIDLANSINTNILITKASKFELDTILNNEIYNISIEDYRTLDAINNIQVLINSNYKNGLISIVDKINYSSRVSKTLISIIKEILPSVKLYTDALTTIELLFGSETVTLIAEFNKMSKERQLNLLKLISN